MRIEPFYALNCYFHKEHAIFLRQEASGPCDPNSAPLPVVCVPLSRHT